MLFDVLDQLYPGDVLILVRGNLASRLLQAWHGAIDFVIRCDSAQGCGAARRFMRSAEQERWDWLLPTDATLASPSELDGTAQRRIRLVRAPDQPQREGSGVGHFAV